MADATKLVVPDEVYKEVMTDYYKGVFGLADTARGRSQAAWAIASTIAGGLITAGLVKDYSNVPTATKVLGIGSVLAWLATALVFMWAVVKPLPGKPDTPAGEVEEVKLAFVENALRFYRDDLHGVQSRQKIALYATTVAVLATILAAGTSVWIKQSIGTIPATVALSTAGETIVRDVCGGQASELSGWIESGSLEKSDLVLQVPLSECPAGAKDAVGKDVAVVLPRADVQGIESPNVTAPLF